MGSVRPAAVSKAKAMAVHLLYHVKGRLESGMYLSKILRQAHCCRGGPFSGGIITVGTVISSCIGVSLFGMIYTMWLV